MPYGIILLPPPEFSNHVVRYAEQLSGGHKMLSLVGDFVPPHVSVLHVECSETEALAWWDALTEASPRPVALRFSGVKFKPMSVGSYYVPEGGTYFGLEAVRTYELETLQERVVAALPESAVAIEGVGEDYSPHITMGVFADVPTLKVALPEPIAMGRTTGYLALGEVAPYGTFPNIIKQVPVSQ